MKEADVRLDIYRMVLYRYHLWPDHFPDIRGVKASGRPDLVVMNPRGPGVYIEVKAFFVDRDKSFAFSNITESQLRWLSEWESQGGLSYIAIGSVNTRQRDIWMIPTHNWKSVIDRVSQFQESLPLREYKFMRNDMRDMQYTFSTMFDWCRLFKEDRLWRLPRDMEEEWERKLNLRTTTS